MRLPELMKATACKLMEHFVLCDYTCSEFQHLLQAEPSSFKNKVGENVVNGDTTPTEEWTQLRISPWISVIVALRNQVSRETHEFARTLGAFNKQLIECSRGVKTKRQATYFYSEYTSTYNNQLGSSGHCHNGYCRCVPRVHFCIHICTRPG